MKKKKIAFIHNTLEVGGAEISLINLLKSLDYAKYEVDLLVLSQYKTLLQEVPKSVRVVFIASEFDKNMTMIEKMKVKRLPSTIQRAVRKIFRETYWFYQRKKEAFDFENYSKTYDVAIAYNQGIVPIYTINHVQADRKVMFFHQGHVKGLEKDLDVYSAFDQIAAVSNGVANQLSSAFPKLASKVTVISNLVDTQTIKKKSLSTIQKPEEGKTLLTSVGRLSREKGFDFAIDVAQRLVKATPTPFEWWIIGDGPMREQLHSKIKAAKLDGVVKLLGKKENPYPYIEQSDVYIQPSRKESYGLALVEAQILGKLVVSTKTLGAQDIIQNQQTGLLVDMEVDKFVDVLKTVLESPEHYDTIRRNLQSVDFRQVNKDTLAKFDQLVQPNL